MSDTYDLIAIGSGPNHDRRVNGNQCKHLEALQASPTLPCKFRGMEWNFGHKCAARARRRAGTRGNSATLPPTTPLRTRVAQETAFWAKKPWNISLTIDLGFEIPKTSAVTGP